MGTIVVALKRRMQTDHATARARAIARSTASRRGQSCDRHVPQMLALTTQRELVLQTVVRDAAGPGAAPLPQPCRGAPPSPHTS
jgi:hypothetical protein